MHHLIKNKIVRRIIKVIVALVVVVILLPFTLYIPFVQNIVKDYACDYASESTGMDIKCDRILLKFPLDISADGVSIVEKGDTMLRVGNLTTGVEFLPLLDLDFKIGDAELTNGYYHMLTTDSATDLAAQIDHCVLTGTDVDMNNHIVNLLDGDLNGGKIVFTSYPYKSKEEPDTAVSTPWRVNAYHLTVHNIDYTMRMLPTIDKLHAFVGEAQLIDGVIDTGDHTVNARTLAVDSLDLKYYTLSTADAATYDKLHPVPPDTIWSPSDTITWTVKGDSLRLTKAHVLYALRGATPKKGLDTDYLELSDANLSINDLFNRGTTVSLALTQLNAKERCGLKIKSASGLFAMDSTKVDLTDFKMSTFLSQFYLDAHAPFTLLEDKPYGSFRIKTDDKIALQEIAMLYPALKTTFKGIPQYNPLALKGEIKGTPDHLDISSLTASIPRYLSATVKGTVDHPMDMKRLSGNLAFDANFQNINFVKPMALDKATAKQVNFPPMTLKGNARFSGNNYSGNVAMRLKNGSAVGSGSFSGSKNSYAVDATFKNFPVKAIMPLAPVNNLTAHVKASGHGFDFLSPNTGLNADVNLGSVVYNNQVLKSMQAHVSMNGGLVKATLNSSNPKCNLFVNADGKIQGDRYIFTVNGNVRDLDTKALGLTDFECNGKGEISAYVDYNMKNGHCNMSADLHNMDWTYDGMKLNSETTELKFLSNDSTVQAYIDNEDTHLNFVSQCNLNDFMKALDRSMTVAQNQFKSRTLNVDALQKALPTFNLELRLGPSGLVPRFLAAYDIDIRDVDCVIRNDSTLFMDGYIHQFSMGTTSIDTITFHANELNNKYLAFNAHMGNRPGTWDEFAQVDIIGGAKDSTIDFLVDQKNIKNETGYHLGINATLAGNFIKTRLFPTNPVIGYRDWTLNDSNYVNFDYTTNMLDANLKLKSDSSTFALSTERTSDPTKENIMLDVDNFILENWIPSLPGMPDMSGVADAKLKVLFDGKNFDGNGVIDLQNFTYEGHEVGNIKFNTDLDVDPATASTKLNGTMEVDGSKVALVYGVLNDSTAADPMNVTAQFERFPIEKASAFIPGGFVEFGGYLDAEMVVKGSMDSLNINGYLKGDSAVVQLPTYGSSLLLSNDRIPVDNGIITFNNYKIYGINGNAATMDGSVNINDMTALLRIDGKNIQFVGSDQKSYSEVFGKGFADIAATINYGASGIDIGAKLSLLAGSNLTYVMQDEVDVLTSSSSSVDENMVTFINPNDSTGGNVMLKTSAATSSTNINVDVNIEEGSKLGAYLSSDGKDRVTVDGSGRLRYSLDFAGKDNLVGTYTINSGNVRYSPPVISQKIFDITSGSLISWTGEMMNPKLDINGTENVKASVTSDGVSKLVEFLVSAKISGTLKTMDILFDMSTESDMTISNQLQAMTAQQRSNTAINLLLYNTYSGGDSGNMNLSASSALYSFLQSQLNSWAASNLKGIDLTFGINEYASGTSSNSTTQTSYSYRLSKNLFNDRFKIVVGGEYSTEASSEQNFSNNLVNDISLEYNLNAAGTKYIRLFRHKGWKSVLEGEITEMGVGFVMKRKAPTLRSLFFKPKRKNVVTLDSTATQPVATEQKQEAAIKNDSNEK